MTDNQYLTLKDLVNSLKKLDQDTLVRCRKLIEDIYFILDKDVTDESYYILCEKFNSIFGDYHGDDKRKELQLSVRRLLPMFQQAYSSLSYPIKNYDIEIIRPTNKSKYVMMETSEKIKETNDWFEYNNYYRDEYDCKNSLYPEHLPYFRKLKNLFHHYFIKIVIEPSIGNPIILKLTDDYGKSIFEIHSYLNPFKHPKDELNKYQGMILEAYREEIEKDKYMCRSVDKNEYPATPEECVSK